MARIAVIGGGIVGVMSALLARQRGHDVEPFEREERVWSRASAANEGKVHLGPIFAMGDVATHRVMIEGSAAFASVVDQALGVATDWDAVCSQEFDYLVMPDSLVSADELGRRYRALNRLLDGYPQMSYLGRPLRQIAAEHAHRDKTTGLAAFHTSERAVDPLRLRDLALRALTETAVVVHTRAEVARVDQSGDKATLLFPSGDRSEPFDAVVNATWERQHAFVPASERHPLNYRVKVAVRVDASERDRAITLVQGPFGDVVRLPDYTYLSWYPTGRIVHESGWEPTAHALASAEQVSSLEALATETVKQLTEIGAHVGETRVSEIVGGFILGHGELDIENPQSRLHARSEFGVSRHGVVLTPISFKLTTAPLVAQRVVDLLDGGR